MDGVTAHTGTGGQFYLRTNAMVDLVEVEMRYEMHSKCQG